MQRIKQRVKFDISENRRLIRQKCPILEMTNRKERVHDKEMDGYHIQTDKEQQ